MKLKFVLALVATLVAGSLQNFAAITELSFGSVEKVASHQVKNTDSLIFFLDFGEGGEYLGETVRYPRADGTLETVHEIAIRSESEFTATIETIVRTIVSQVLTIPEYAVRAEGKTFTVRCYGNKFGATGKTIVLNQRFSPERVGDILQVDEESYRIDLVEAIRSRYSISVFVPKILSAFLEVEDDWGFHRVDGSLDEYGNDGGMQYRAKEERIIIRTHWLFEPRKGSIRIRYQGGAEELISLTDWKPLITYLSPPASAPFRRSGLPSIREGKLAIPYEAEPWRVVNVEKSTTPWDPSSWRATSGVTYLPTLTPASTGSGAVSVQTAVVAIDSEFAVYRLRDGESVAPQRR